MSTRRLLVLSFVVAAGCGSSGGLPVDPACGNAGQACCASVGCYDGLACVNRICAGGGNDLGMRDGAACSPAAEVCDGKDNDCNGIVDDDAPCPANQVCSGGACRPLSESRWVIDSMTLPIDRSSNSIDLNGDGKPDNALANIVNLLTSQTFAVQESQDAAIRGGSALHLLRLSSTDPTFTSDASASATLTLAVPKPAPDLSGKGAFTVDANVAPGRFHGALTAGTFDSANPVTTQEPVTFTLALALFFDKSPPTPMRLPVNGAHLVIRSAGAAAVSGQIQGSIKSSDINDIMVPAIAASLTADVQANPSSASTKQILSIFDTGGCQGAVRGDGIISPCEVANSALIKNLLAPDIQVYDAQGHYAPNPAGPAKDSLSIGLGFTAVRATF